MTEFLYAAKWFVIAAGFVAIVWGLARMFNPSREKRCDTCVFSTCSAYPKLACSVIKRDVPPYFVCEKWK